MIREPQHGGKTPQAGQAGRIKTFLKVLSAAKGQLQMDHN